MQIHELNNFTGTLGAGAYLAVDDGNDTGKLSTQQLLAATEARIDNIIAGPAPSAEEIVDARLGDDGVTYPSLGDAIRDQVGDLKSAFPVVSGNVYDGTYTPNCYINQGNGATVAANGWNITDYIPLESGETYYLFGGYSAYSFACYNGNKTFVDVRSNTDMCANNNIKSKITVPSNVKYLRLSFNDLNGIKMLCVTKAPNADQFTSQKELYAKKNEYAASGVVFVDGKYNPMFFLNGTLGNDHNPGTYSNTNTVCSAEMFYAPYDLTISLDSGTMSVSLFDDDGIFESDTGFVSTPISIARGKHYKINIRSTSADTTENIVALATVTADSMNQYNDLFVPSCLKTILFQCRDGKVTNSVPPDSVYSIKMTAKNQYDIIRFSAVKTTDDKYVAVHDVYINDLATNLDGSAISSTIYTADCSLAELNNYDWGLKFGQQYAGLQVPMLEDCIKYATMYGLAVAIDFKFVPTDTDIDNISAMLAKYSQLNAILIALSITNMQKFHNKSPLFSFDFGGTEEQIEANVYWFNQLKGNHNRIYINAFPFGEPPTDSAIALAMANDLDIWFTPIEGIEELKSVGFNHGIKLYECHYITNIKSTVRAYADSLIG